jgi:hypothetical protein
MTASACTSLRSRVHPSQVTASEQCILVAVYKCRFQKEKGKNRGEKGREKEKKNTHDF